MSGHISLLAVLLVVAACTQLTCGNRVIRRDLNNRESSLLLGDSQSQREEGGSASASSSWSNHSVVGFLPLPPGYNKLAIPSTKNSSIFVFMYLSIRQILDVDIEKGLLELDTELGMTWLDWEIWNYFLNDTEAQEKAKRGPDEIILDSEFLKSIWKPDVFIEELASVETTYLLSKQITLAFLVLNTPIVGAIRAKSRQTLKVRCDMDFQFYPADTQKCQLNLRSYTYPQNELFLLWAPNQSVYLDQIDDPNYNFQVSNVEPGNSLYELYTTYQAPCCTPKNFSTLSFTIELRRNLTYHFVQTCLPSILLILITWLCFLLPQDMVEARIGISMTTLLTITAMFAAVREQAPSVSYTMAIDIWMVFCIFFIFMSLVLFTVIYWMRRRYVKSGPDAVKDEFAEVEANHTNGEVGNQSQEQLSAEEKKSKDETYGRIVHHVKNYAFGLFACIFIAFLLGFGGWLLTWSEYYSWEPSPKYNAIGQVDDDSNRLFTKKEERFWDNATSKVVEAEFRFVDILNDVICPKLKELDPDDPCDADEE